MKKITLLFYAAIITSCLFPQETTAQPDYKLDSIQSYIWNDPILPNDWLMQIRDHFTYTNGGVNWTERLTLAKDNDTPLTWINSTNHIRTYNASDQLESDIFQFWTGAVFMNSSKIEYSYDVSGNNDVSTFYNYAPSPIDWLPTGRDLMTYNGTNLVTEKTSQMYNPVSMMFDTNLSQTRYTYNNELPMQEDFHNWDGIAMDWNATPNHRTIYDYSGMLVSTITWQVDNGSGLENSDLATYSYNGNNIDTILFQSYNGTSWDDENRTVFSVYDVNDLPLEVITYTSTGPSTWLEQYKANYFWSEAALHISSEALHVAKVLPNPFSADLKILLASPLNELSTLSIIDVHGKELSRTDLNPGTKTIHLSNPNLTSGLYFIKVIGVSQRFTFKVIKQ